MYKRRVAGSGQLSWKDPSITASSLTTYWVQDWNYSGNKDFMQEQTTGGSAPAGLIPELCVWHSQGATRRVSRAKVSPRESAGRWGLSNGCSSLSEASPEGSQFKLQPGGVTLEEREDTLAIVLTNKNSYHPHWHWALLHPSNTEAKPEEACSWKPSFIGKTTKATTAIQGLG